MSVVVLADRVSLRSGSGPQPVGDGLPEHSGAAARQREEVHGARAEGRVAVTTNAWPAAAPRVLQVRTRAVNGLLHPSHSKTGTL